MFIIKPELSQFEPAISNPTKVKLIMFVIYLKHLVSPERHIKGAFTSLPLLELTSSKHPMPPMFKLASVMLELPVLELTMTMTITIAIAMTMSKSVTICCVSVRTVRAMSYVVSSVGSCSTCNHTPDSSCVS